MKTEEECPRDVHNLMWKKIVWNQLSNVWSIKNPGATRKPIDFFEWHRKMENLQCWARLIVYEACLRCARLSISGSYLLTVSYHTGIQSMIFFEKNFQLFHYALRLKLFHKLRFPVIYTRFVWYKYYFIRIHRIFPWPNNKITRVQPHPHRPSYSPKNPRHSILTSSGEQSQTDRK